MAMTYLHSHVHTDIIDNSVIASVSDGGTVGFFPIFSDKGKENELVLIDGDVRTFVDTYGTDGVKFGQAQLNVRQWLLGGGSAYVMRLLPDDATYASAAVVVNVDSYMPIYKLNVKLFKPGYFDNPDADPEADENVFAKEDYLVKEDFIFDGSTVKELRLCKFSVRNSNPKYETLFRTGRGTTAESSYDFSEDWMRKNDKVVVDNSAEIEEETGLHPVKSYVNYNMVASANGGKVSGLEEFLKVGTKTLSPAATQAILGTLANNSNIEPHLAIAVEYDGVKDLVFTRAESRAKYFVKVNRVSGALEYYKSYNSETKEFSDKVDDVKELASIKFATLPASEYSVKDPKGKYDRVADEVLDLYVPATKDLYIVNTTEIEYNTESNLFENAYFPLADSETESTEPHAFVTSGLLTDIASKLLSIAIAPFGDDADEANPNTCRGMKDQLFANCDKINVYYSFADSVIEHNGEEVKLSSLVSVEVEDLASDTQYFLDSYPIEVFSKPSTKTATKKIWNAKIVVTDSDGTSKDVVIFRESIPESEYESAHEAIFTLEEHVYYALNALCKDGGKIYEPKRGPAFLEAKGAVDEQGHGVYSHAMFVEDNGSYGLIEYSQKTEKDAFKAVQWLNKEDLSSAVYAGNLAFTRKDADKITVELYTPNKNACKTLDGIKLDIYNYCTVFNNTISNLLDGKKKYPIGYFVANCRGEYYNNMKVYIKPNDGLKDTYPDFRLYDLEVYDCANDKTQLIDGPYTVSFDKTAIDTAGGSLYIKSILDTYGKKDANGDIAVNFYDDVDQDAFSDLCKDLSSLFRLKHPKFVFSNAAVDPFFVPQVDENILSQGDPDYEYHSYMAYTDDETIPEDQRSLRIQGDNNISTATSLRLDEGFFLANGSSGTLFDKKGNLIQSAYRKLMVQAYNGGLNPHVFDIRNYEFDVILDAKFPKAVKIAMVQLASSLRRDCIVCLDTDNMLSNTSGPATSAQAAIEARKSINTNDYAASIWCQNSVAYDEYTDRDIPVSATYFLSYKIPFNDKANGIQTAFVGPRRGTMDLYKEFDWYPTEAEKERLYKAQINYVSKDPRRIAFDSQLTSQVVTSALSNIPNVRVLFKIKRAVEKICDDYRFERNNGGTRVDMEDQVNEYLKSWVNNGACETCTATVTASDYQIKQKMAQVAIDVVFVGFLERIHIVINVNG